MEIYEVNLKDFEYTIPFYILTNFLPAHLTVKYTPLYGMAVDFLLLAE